MSSLSIESGLRAAKAKALSNTEQYMLAKRVFGSFLDQYLGDAPKDLAVGHVLHVNPNLIISPSPTSDQRRGFMYATRTMTQAAGVTWEKLDDPSTCAYVWGRDINNTSKNLYTSNQTLFPSSNADFWQCSYLSHILGSSAFGVIWRSRNRNSATVYEGLLYAVNQQTKSLPGWPIVRLKRTVFIDCAYVFELAKRGGTLTTSGYGLEPVLKRTSMEEVYGK